MNPLDSFRFPFLGSREDGETFEYLLMEISQEKAQIAIFKWMVNSLNLNLEEKIELFIPDILTAVYSLRNNTPGIIISLAYNEENQAYFYEVSFIHKHILTLPETKTYEGFTQNIQTDSSLIEILMRLIKDCCILKQGINVYLKHFAPFFSRMVDYSKEDYSSLKKIVFEDTENRITLNEKSLNKIYYLLKFEIKNESDIAIIVNLEDLRENIESEISYDLFFVVFAEVDSSKELLTLLKESRYQDNLKLQYKYMNYLIAIKNLEKRLYSNYNKIVLTYAKSI